MTGTLLFYPTGGPSGTTIGRHLKPNPCDLGPHMGPRLLSRVTPWSHPGRRKLLPHIPTTHGTPFFRFTSPLLPGKYHLSGLPHPDSLGVSTLLVHPSGSLVSDIFPIHLTHVSDST